MKVILTILLTLLSTNAFAQCSDGKILVTRVIDGDTIEVKGGDKIRILGIDTFDINKRMAKKQAIRTGYSKERVKFLSEKASRVAKNLLLMECVTLTKDYRDKGRYGRKLRYVTIHGRDFQKIMLEKGLANVYCGDKKAKRYKKYLAISKFKCN